MGKQLALLVKVVLVTFILISLTKSIMVHAAQISQRSVIIGSSVSGAVTTHDYSFTTTTSGSIGSVVFEYCTNLPYYGTGCTAPTGLAVNTATITSQSGITGLSVSVPDTTANRLVLTRANSVVAPTPVTVDLANITNQNTTESVFVRISTHTANNGSGSPIDFGAVVYATAENVAVAGTVPPFLRFCVGTTVGPTCNTIGGALMTLGELTNISPSTATSQFAAATNDVNGYNVFISGATMTAGNEIIPALSTNSASITGVSQFGVNLRANTVPIAGANVSGTGTGFATPNYGVQNSYRFVSGELMASSSLPTEYNRYTVTYLVNVSDSQKPGIYASSFTYTAIATF